jgi:hypothetical protein
MRHHDLERPARNRVTALFEARALSFDLASDATLEDLAKRLAHLRTRHDGTLVGIAVKVGGDRR